MKKKEIIPFHSGFVVSHFNTDRNEIFCRDNIQHIKTCNVKWFIFYIFPVRFEFMVYNINRLIEFGTFLIIQFLFMLFSINLKTKINYMKIWLFDFLVNRVIFKHGWAKTSELFAES
jgi:hypothetical protein